MFNVSINILRVPAVKGIGLLFFLLILLSTFTLADERIPAGFHVSVSTGFLRTELPKNFYLDPYQNEIRLDSSEAEDRVALFNYNSSFSYGVSIGYSHKLFTNDPSHKLYSKDIFQIYGQISFYPQFKFADETENVRIGQYDPVRRKTVYQNIQYNQTGRKANVILIKAGFIFFPSVRKPLAMDGYFGLSILHREYVSGATREYEDTVDIDPLKDVDIGDHQGNGKWEKNYLGFSGGGGVTYFFIKRFSITLMIEGGASSKQVSTKTYYGQGAITAYYSGFDVKQFAPISIFSLKLTYYF